MNVLRIKFEFYSFYKTLIKLILIFLKPKLQNAIKEVDSYANLTNCAMCYVKKVVDDEQLVDKLNFVDDVSKKWSQMTKDLNSASDKASNTSQTVEESKSLNKIIHEMIKKLTKDIESKK
jgi:hypothetical protein